MDTEFETSAVRQLLTIFHDTQLVLDFHMKKHNKKLLLLSESSYEWQKSFQGTL